MKVRLGIGSSYLKLLYHDLNSNLFEYIQYKKMAANVNPRRIM